MISRYLETKFPNGVVGRLVRPSVATNPSKAYAYYESAIDVFGTVHFVFQCWESVPNPELKWAEIEVTEATVRLLTSARKFRL